jgi:hypothetical protein
MQYVKYLVGWAVGNLAAVFLLPAIVKRVWEDPTILADDIVTAIFGPPGQPINQTQVRITIGALVTLCFAAWIISRIIKGRAAASRSPRTISALAAVQYIAKESSWGWRCRATSEWWLIEIIACEEFVRGAKNGAISVSGRKWGAGLHEAIPQAYWLSAKLDSQSIITGIGNGKTEPMMQGIPKYEDLHLVAAEVESTWARAGSLLRLSSPVIYGIRWLWFYGVTLAKKGAYRLGFWDGKPKER